MSSGVIIIDDQNTNVTHSGSWSFQGVQQEFQTTTSTSDTQGSTLQLKFYGSSVRVYGTVGFGATTSMSFKVDSLGSQTYTAQGSQATPQFHTNFFSQDSLSLDAAHTLVVTQANSPSPSNMFIDYFLLTIPFNTTGFNDNVGETSFFDDSNSQISYSGSWNANAGTDQDLQGTLHGSGGEGATATFKFDGTDITVFGNVHQGSTGNLATFTVDGDSGSAFTYPAPSPSPSFTFNVSSNLKMFNANNLGSGNHTLVMSAQGSDFFFDYATVTGFTRPATSSGNGGGGSGGDGGDGGGGGGSSKSDTGAIVGGVVGGIVGAAFLAALLFFVVRRRRRTANSPGRKQTIDVAGGGAPGSEYYNSESAEMAHYQANSQSGGFASSSNAAMMGGGALGAGAALGADAGAGAASSSSHHAMSPPRGSVASGSGSQSRPYAESSSPPTSTSGQQPVRRLPSPPPAAPPPSTSTSFGLGVTNPTSPSSASQDSSSVAAAVGPGSNVASAKALAAANVVRPEPELRIHQDSGVRGEAVDAVLDGDRRVEELPPQYTAE